MPVGTTLDMSLVGRQEWNVVRERRDLVSLDWGHVDLVHIGQRNQNANTWYLQVRIMQHGVPLALYDVLICPSSIPNTS